MWCALEDYPKPHVAPLDGGLDVNQQTAQMPLSSLYSLFQRVNTMEAKLTGPIHGKNLLHDFSSK